MRNLIHLSGVLLIISGILLILAVFSKSIFSQTQTGTAEDMSAVCFNPEKTWIQHEGEISIKAEPINRFLRKPQAFLPNRKTSLDNYFQGKKYDCVAAFPSTYPYIRRIQNLVALGANAQNVQIVSVSDSVVAGYTFFHISEKESEKDSTKIFITIGTRHISATLATIGSGVIEIHGSVGIPLLSKQATAQEEYVPLINQIVKKLSHIPLGDNLQYDEIVVTGTDILVKIVAGMKASSEIKVPVSGYDRLILEGLLTQSAIMANNPEVGSILLLGGTPNTSLGIIFPSAVNVRTKTRVGRIIKVPADGEAENQSADGFLSSEMVRFEQLLNPPVQPGRYLELIAPFTNIPTRQTIEVDFTTQPPYLLVAEYSGDSIFIIQKVALKQNPKTTKSASRYEISLELDSRMFLQLLLKNLADGSIRQHRMALSMGKDRSFEKVR